MNVLFADQPRWTSRIQYADSPTTPNAASTTGPAPTLTASMTALALKTDNRHPGVPPPSIIAISTVLVTASATKAVTVSFTTTNSQNTPGGEPTTTSSNVVSVTTCHHCEAVERVIPAMPRRIFLTINGLTRLRLSLC
nr:unnamed protein product [Spirometra erinaceieuropaei]